MMKPTVIVPALATLTVRLVIGVVKPRVEPGGTLRERGRERVRGAGQRERPGRAAGADGDLELGASAGAERELGAGGRAVEPLGDPFRAANVGEKPCVPHERSHDLTISLSGLKASGLPR